MTGLDKERSLVTALRRFFKIETDDRLDKSYCIDAVIIRPCADLVEVPFFPAPILAQITWNSRNWYKRMNALEKIQGIRHEHMAFIEVNSEEVSALIIFGVFNALTSLWMDEKIPKYALIEVAADGRYKISDLQKSWDQLVERLNSELKNQEFQGRLVFWEQTHGFIEVEIPNREGELETITFYCGDRYTDKLIVERFANSGQIDSSRQPTVVFTNDGCSPRGFRGLAGNVRLKPETSTP